MENIGIPIRAIVTVFFFSFSFLEGLDDLWKSFLRRWMGGELACAIGVCARHYLRFSVSREVYIVGVRGLILYSFSKAVGP